MATGRHVDIAINHDPIAIAMHKANHPKTKHYLESVWDVDPQEATKGQPVGLMWLSPDCTHFSKARGGKPKKNAVRGLAWLAVRWAKTARPRVIVLENVEEFQTWGPLLATGQPCPERKGQTFNLFVKQLRRLGYKVDWRELRACDYGAPTTRKRLFLIARCDGSPIVWPEPTHGEPDSLLVVSGVQEPYRTAAECIDWSLPCPGIFTRKRPLVENTLRRIAGGLEKFVFENPKPFIVEKESGAQAHFLTQYHSYDSSPRGQAIDSPLLTQDTSNRYALVTSHLIKFKGTNLGQRVREPIQTITAGGTHFGEVRTFLVKYYGRGAGQALDRPLDTVTTKDRFGLVTVLGQEYQIADIGLRMLQPKELYLAQGFPKGYIFAHDSQGNPITKKEQVAKCGNSVPPPFAEALVRANLPEMCKAKQSA
jgi:DNA (cytosine-5)-methyltransferase 1